MQPSPVRDHRTPPRVDLRQFKVTAFRLLPAGHPLLRILDRTPDEIDAGELGHRFEDWLLLVEGA